MEPWVLGRKHFQSKFFSGAIPRSREGETTVSKFASLEGAISANVNDGDTIALEGFTHLIPMAAGHEIIRQRKRELTAVRLTPDLIYEPVDWRWLREEIDLLLGWKSRCWFAP